MAVKDLEGAIGRITGHPGGTISLTYQRNGATHTVQVGVTRAEVAGKTVGHIEAELEQPVDVPYPPSMVRHLRLSPFAAVGRATAEAWSMTALQGRLFWRMMLGQVSLKNLSGPVSIAQYAGQSASEGAGAFLDFLVLISLSLGFLNLLPIPILDGGQIVFQAVEWLKGSPLSERAQAFGQQVGIALLILLMGVALFNDIARQFS
jgi:regulator of sigma E protease